MEKDNQNLGRAKVVIFLGWLLILLSAGRMIMAVMGQDSVMSASVNLGAGIIAAGIGNVMKYKAEAERKAQAEKSEHPAEE